jgi:hypothetical protein
MPQGARARAVKTTPMPARADPPSPHSPAPSSPHPHRPPRSAAHLHRQLERVHPVLSASQAALAHSAHVRTHMCVNVNVNTRTPRMRVRPTFGPGRAVRVLRLTPTRACRTRSAGSCELGWVGGPRSPTSQNALAGGLEDLSDGRGHVVLVDQLRARV